MFVGAPLGGSYNKVNGGKQWKPFVESGNVDRGARLLMAPQNPLKIRVILMKRDVPDYLAP